jgi:hypothetical protein
MRTRIGASVILLSLLAGPAALVADGEHYDNFNRPDGSPAGWLPYQGLAEIRSNELLCESSGAEVWTWIDTTVFSGDIVIQLDLRFDAPDADPAVGRHGGIMFFASERTWRYSPSMNGYTIDWIDRATPDHGYRFHKWTAGVESILVPDMSAPDPEPGTTWRIEVTGPTITFEVDGVEKFSWDDLDWREGAIGIWGWSNGQHIHVDNVAVGVPPAPRITAEPADGKAPLEVRFDGTASTSPAGSITSYEWAFGDGETGTGDRVTHTYRDAGRYLARLTITDPRGASASATAAVNARFASGPVDPWTSADVGAPAFPGGARIEGDCILVAGGGSGIAGLEDEHHLVAQTKSGDAVLTVRLEDVAGSGWKPGARAGVMFREGPGPDAGFAMMAAHPTAAGVQAVFLARGTAGARVTVRTSPLVIIPPAAWLRLERKGADFIGSASPDGVTWTMVRTVTLPAPPESMLAGLAVTAADATDQGLFVQASFCGAVFGEPPPGGFRRGDSDSSGDVNLTDAIRILNVLFQGIGEIVCGDAADADDSGDLNLTDAIRILNVLFQGIGTIPPPGSETCGPDPTDDSLPACTTPAC